MSDIVSAVELARHHGLNAKALRHAFRAADFRWHQHGARWIGAKGSPEAADIERVARELEARRRV